MLKVIMLTSECAKLKYDCARTGGEIVHALTAVRRPAVCEMKMDALRYTMINCPAYSQTKNHT